MDLRIKNNNATKSYVITNNCTTRPRVCMKSDTGVPATPISYLPLTTSTTQGLALRAKVNDQSYRALEFRSMSGSATYYTSGANSAGMSSTTALTRVSTSRTEYLTRKSTSATSYLTRSSTSGTSYLTMSNTRRGTFVTQELAYFYSGDYWFYTGRTSSFVGITNFIYESYTFSGSNIDYQYYTDTAYTISLFGTISNTLTYYTSLNGGGHGQTLDIHSGWGTGGVFAIDCISKIGSTTGMQFYWQRGARVNESYSHSVANGIDFYTKSNIYTDQGYYTNYVTNSGTASGDLRTSTQVTTATSYLTRASTSDTVYYTRSSTYDTVYHTRASTSGYSGISSSSSETSGWQ